MEGSSAQFQQCSWAQRLVLWLFRTFSSFFQRYAPRMHAQLGGGLEWIGVVHSTPKLLVLSLQHFWGLSLGSR